MQSNKLGSKAPTNIALATFLSEKEFQLVLKTESKTNIGSRSVIN